MSATPERMAELYDKMEAGNVTYEEVAELFENTMTGQYAMRESGLTRAQFIERIREKYPTPQALGALMQQFIAMLPDAIRPKPRTGPTSGSIH